MHFNGNFFFSFFMLHCVGQFFFPCHVRVVFRHHHGVVYGALRGIKKKNLLILHPIVCQRPLIFFTIKIFFLYVFLMTIQKESSISKSKNFSFFFCNECFRNCLKNVLGKFTKSIGFTYPYLCV